MVLYEKILSDEIKDLQKKIFLKQSELLEMQDFYKITDNDSNPLQEYIEEIKNIEYTLDVKIDNYRNNKKLKKDLDLLNY